MNWHLQEWLKKSPRYLTPAAFYNLSDEDRRLLLEDYLEYSKKEAEKVGRLERQRKEKLDKYLQKLHNKKATKK
jgi:hypothetical protein